jgi:hypothetical protein
MGKKPCPTCSPEKILNKHHYNYVHHKTPSDFNEIQNNGNSENKHFNLHNIHNIGVIVVLYSQNIDSFFPDTTKCQLFPHWGRNEMED